MSKFGVLMMKSVLFGLIALLLPLNAVAIDADGFFFAEPLEGGLGPSRTRAINGVVHALYKVDKGFLVVCLKKDIKSKDCDGPWVSPSEAVATLVDNACYLGFEISIGGPAFLYRVNRSCEEG